MAIIIILILAVFIGFLFLVAYRILRTQGKYHPKTSRTYVYAKGPWLRNTPEFPDSLFDITIEIINAGELPAKNIRIWSFFGKTKKNKSGIPIIPEEIKVTEVSTGLFPGQITLASYHGGQRTKEEIREIINNEGDLFHMIVVFKDMNDEPHFYWRIAVCYKDTFKFVNVDMDFN